MVTVFVVIASAYTMDNDSVKTVYYYYSNIVIIDSISTIVNKHFLDVVLNYIELARTRARTGKQF